MTLANIIDIPFFFFNLEASALPDLEDGKDKGESGRPLEVRLHESNIRCQ
jgi:hypothetical protein